MTRKLWRSSKVGRRHDLVITRWLIKFLVALVCRGCASSIRHLELGNRAVQLSRMGARGRGLAPVAYLFSPCWDDFSPRINIWWSGTAFMIYLCIWDRICHSRRIALKGYANEVYRAWLAVGARQDQQMVSISSSAHVNLIHSLTCPYALDFDFWPRNPEVDGTKQKQYSCTP